jgi:hypothetical protein
MDFEVFYVHHLREGKLARLDMIFSRDQALEAVRLRSSARFRFGRTAEAAFAG